MNLGSARDAIHDALAWGHLQKGESGLVEYLRYLTRVEKSYRQNNSGADFLEAAYICAAIETLPKHICGWIKFSYGPDDLKIIQSILARKLCDDFFSNVSSVKKNQRLFALAQSSIEGYRLRVWQSRDLPVSLYCARMGVDASHWSRDWAESHDLYIDAIRRWDAEGVGCVSRMVRSLRGESDLRPTEILEELQKTA